MDMLTDGGTSGKITEGERKGRETAGKAPSPAGVGGSAAAAVGMAAPHGTSSLTRCALLLLLLFLPLLPTVAAVLPWAQGSRSRRAARKWRAGSGGHGASAALRHFGHRGMEPRGWGAVRGLQLKGEVWDCLRRQQRGVTDAGLQVYVPSVKDGSSVRAGIKLPGDRWAGWQEKGIPSYLLLVFVSNALAYHLCGIPQREAQTNHTNHYHHPQTVIHVLTKNYSNHLCSYLWDNLTNHNSCACNLSALICFRVQVVFFFLFFFSCSSEVLLFSPISQKNPIPWRETGFL